MLYFHIKETELYDEKNNEFIKVPDIEIKMEHSLVSISKWESKYHKSFFKENNKTNEELIEYIYFMIYSPENLSKEIFYSFIMDKNNFNKILEYINDPMTAVYFREDENSKKSGDTITYELIYYQMISLQIPVEFENWHINRLLSLIKVCAIKNTPPKKRSLKQLMSENDALNEARKKKLKTKG